MNINKLVNFLEESGLSEVEVLLKENKYNLVNMYLDFDADIISAATAYADGECSDKESEDWLNKYYFEYLYDFANDEVVDIAEEISEEFELAVEVMAVQIKDKSQNYVQFMLLISDEDCDVSIEEAIKEYNS